MFMLILMLMSQYHAVRSMENGGGLPNNEYAADGRNVVLANNSHTPTSIEINSSDTTSYVNSSALAAVAFTNLTTEVEPRDMVPRDPVPRGVCFLYVTLSEVRSETASVTTVTHELTWCEDADYDARKSGIRSRWACPGSSRDVSVNIVACRNGSRSVTFADVRCNETRKVDTCLDTCKNYAKLFIAGVSYFEVFYGV